MLDKIKLFAVKVWGAHKRALLIMLVGLILFQTAMIISRSFDPDIPIPVTILMFLGYFAILLGAALIIARKKETIKRFLSKIPRAYKAAFLIFLSGLIMYQTSNVILRSVDPVIPTSVSILKYLAYFSLLLGILLITAKRKWIISSNIIVIIMLVWAVEVTCFALLGFPEGFMVEYTTQHYSEDNRARYLGFSPAEDTTYTEHTIKNNDTLFSATYTLNEYGYRETPEIDSLNGKYNLFFGCSITLGYGLNDDQTIAYHFQEESKAKSYNLAWNAYGTNHMLSILQNEDLTKQVKEKDGTAYYIFFWDHINRSIGAMKHYLGWMFSSPYYYMDGGKLVQDRTFVDGRYWQSKFYEIFSQSSIKKYFEIELPLGVNDAHFDLVSEMVLESKKEYKKQFGNDNFVLVIYPAYKAYTDAEMKEFKGYLKKKKIRFVDLSNFIKYGPAYSLNGDGHPNSGTNAIVAEELLKRMR